MKLINLIGHKFGKLDIIEFAGTSFDNPKRAKRGRWLCKCECGNTTIVDSYSLRGGKVVGCGKCRSNIGNQHGNYDLKSHDSAFMMFFRSVRGSAKVRGIEFILTSDEVREISVQDCAYCGCHPHAVEKCRNKYGLPFVHNGIDRVDNSIGYVFKNCTPCCEICNRMKLSLTVDEFTEHIAQIYSHLVK